MSKPQPGQHHGHAPAALGLLLLGLATLGLGVFQWYELHVVESGGRAVCTLNATVNCETVWNSPLALSLHQTLGVPVAGLGILWGAVASVCALWLLLLARRGLPVRDLMGAVRVTALMGFLGVVVFAAASIGVGALCLTCLGTYVLVLGFAAGATFGLPRPLFPRGGEWWTALGLPSLAALATYLLLLIPGRSEPRSLLAHATSKPGGLEAFLANASPPERQAISDNLALYRLESSPGDLPPERNRLGDASAPVKVVEWTDIRCSHCKHFNEVLESLRAILPSGSLSVEARNFPLDGMCNPVIPQTANGVSCEGARALICLESAPDFWKLRDKLFEAQASLTREKILDIATSTFSVSRTALESCMASRETATRLLEDISYAQRYHPTGTPTIAVNGKLAPASGPFLFVLAMTAGNPDAPALAALPPPARSAQKEPQTPVAPR
jgi:serine/threonine-protein kinase